MSCTKAETLRPCCKGLHAQCNPLVPVQQLVCPWRGVFVSMSSGAAKPVECSWRLTCICGVRGEGGGDFSTAKLVHGTPQDHEFSEQAWITQHEASNRVLTIFA